jgi:hypothetical protein
VQGFKPTSSALSGQIKTRKHADARDALKFRFNELQEGLGVPVQPLRYNAAVFDHKPDLRRDF